MNETKPATSTQLQWRARHSAYLANVREELIPLFRTSKETLRNAEIEVSRNNVKHKTTIERELILGLARDNMPWLTKVARAQEWLAGKLCGYYRLDLVRDQRDLKAIARKCINYYVRLGDYKDPLMHRQWWGDGPKLLEAYTSGVSPSIICAADMKTMYSALYTQAVEILERYPVLGRKEKEDLERELTELLQPTVTADNMTRVISGLVQSHISKTKGFASMAEYRAYPELVVAVRDYNHLQFPQHLRERVKNIMLHEVEAVGTDDMTVAVDSGLLRARTFVGKYIYQVAVPGSSAVPMQVAATAAALVDKITGSIQGQAKEQLRIQLQIQSVVSDTAIKDYLVTNWPKGRIKKKTRKLQCQNPQTLRAHARWLMCESEHLGQMLDFDSALASIKRLHNELYKFVAAAR